MTQLREWNRVRASLCVVVLACAPPFCAAQVLRQVAAIDQSYFGVMAPNATLTTDGTSFYFTGGPSQIFLGSGNQDYYWTIGRFTPGVGVSRLAVIGTNTSPGGHPPLGSVYAVGNDVWFLTDPNPPNIGSVPVRVGHWAPGMSGPQYLAIPSPCGAYGDLGQMAVIGTSLYFSTSTGAQFNRGALCRVDTTSGQITKLADNTSLVGGPYTNLTAVGQYLVGLGTGFNSYPGLVTYDTMFGASPWVSTLFGQGGVGIGSPTIPPRVSFDVANGGVEFILADVVCYGCPVYYRAGRWDPVAQSLSFVRDNGADPGFTLRRVLTTTTGHRVFAGGGNGYAGVMADWPAGGTITGLEFSANHPLSNGVRAGDRVVFLSGQGIMDWTDGPDQATSQVLGAGCTTLGGGPTLTMSPPRLGVLGSISVDNAPPQWGGLFMLSDAVAGSFPTGLGCDVWLDPFTLGTFATIQTNAAGHWAYYAGPMNDPMLAGLHFRAQSVVIAPAGADYGVTNGVELVTGF